MLSKIFSSQATAVANMQQQNILGQQQFAYTQGLQNVAYPSSIHAYQTSPHTPHGQFLEALKIFELLEKQQLPVTKEVLEKLTILCLKDPYTDMNTLCAQAKKELFSEDFNAKLAE